jgi:hypothetical protein
MMLMAQLLLPVQQRRCQKLRYFWRWSRIAVHESEREKQQKREQRLVREREQEHELRQEREQLQELQGKQRNWSETEELQEEAARLQILQQRTVQKNESLQQLCEELEKEKLRMAETYREELQQLTAQKQQMAVQLAEQRERAAALREEAEHAYGMFSAKQEQQAILEKRVQQLLLDQRNQTRHAFLDQKRDVQQTLMEHQFEEKMEQQLEQCQHLAPPPLPPPAVPPSSFRREEHQQQRWLNAAKLRASSHQELRQQELIFSHGARFVHTQSLLRRVMEKSFHAQMHTALQRWQRFAESTASEDVEKYFAMGRSTPAPVVSHNRELVPRSPGGAEAEAADVDVERYFRLAQSGRRGVCA